MRVLVKAVAGSHLFGLNTPQSDKDYKGVYLPTAEDILLGRVKRSIKESTGNDGQKNTKDDEDCEFYSFDKFLKMLQEGQTVAIELLFTPNEFIIEKDPMWDEIVAMRERFLHKKVTAFIGYAKQQAAKYGIRGSRMGAIEKVIKVFEKENGYKSLGDIEPLLESLSKEEYINIVEIPKNKNMVNCYEKHFEVIGKKFGYSVKLNYVLPILKKFYGEYGERSVAAKLNKGIDWKAVSHAIRVCHQGIELLSTGKLTLPLKNPMRDYIKDVKLGNFDFTEIVKPAVERELINLEAAKNWSTLPEELDNDFIDGLITKTYRKIVNEGY